MSAHIGRKIRELRDARDLSQQRFGQKIGLSGKTISAYETGKCIPPLRVLEEISKVYEVPILHMETKRRKELTARIQYLRNSLTELEVLINESITS